MWIYTFYQYYSNSKPPSFIWTNLQTSPLSTSTFCSPSSIQQLDGSFCCSSAQNPTTFQIKFTLLNYGCYLPLQPHLSFMYSPCSSHAGLSVTWSLVAVLHMVSSLTSLQFLTKCHLIFGDASSMIKSSTSPLSHSFPLSWFTFLISTVTSWNHMLMCLSPLLRFKILESKVFIYSNHRTPGML